jgi:hypothetical protein
MADFRNAIPAFPADLRGKETAIPAGYLHENKETAGKAGIETNPKEFWEFISRMHARDCAHPYIKGPAAIPAIPAELVFSAT